MPPTATPAAKLAEVRLQSAINNAKYIENAMSQNMPAVISIVVLGAFGLIWVERARDTARGSPRICSIDDAMTLLENRHRSLTAGNRQ